MAERPFAAIYTALEKRFGAGLIEVAIQEGLRQGHAEHRALLEFVARRCHERSAPPQVSNLDLLKQADKEQQEQRRIAEVLAVKRLRAKVKNVVARHT